MKSNQAVIAATFIQAGIAVVAHAASSSDGCNSYTKFPHGKTTYSLDDGGCFLCAERESRGSTASPLSGAALAESCRALCDSDPRCASFTVGRRAVMPAHDHRWGKHSNCCLERREYPPEAFVDPMGEERDGAKLNSCHHDAMCWTRYEKNGGKGGVDASGRRCEEDGVAEDVPPTPANLCSAVWEEETYSDEELRTKLDFIRRGCDYNDTTFESMLAKAYSTCRAEVIVESTAVYVISHSSAVYTHVIVDL